MAQSNITKSLDNVNSDQSVNKPNLLNKNQQSIRLFEIPSSAFLFHLCPCLNAFDLLSLRASNKQCHNLLHHETGEL